MYIDRYLPCRFAVAACKSKTCTCTVEYRLICANAAFCPTAFPHRTSRFQCLLLLVMISQLLMHPSYQPALAPLLLMWLARPKVFHAGF